MLALSLTVDDLFNCEDQLKDKFAESNRNHKLYMVESGRREECDSIRGALAFELNASQRDNQTLTTDNANLKTGKKNLGWGLFSSIMVNVVLAIAVIAK